MSNPGEKRAETFVNLLWAGRERAEAIAGLHGALFAEPWSVPSVVSLLEHPGGTSLVAVPVGQKEIAGFALGRVAADEAELLSIGVASSWQRRGVARQLVNGLKRAAKRADARRLHLEVAADNLAAAALYRALGFAEVGRRRGYYQRGGGRPAADAILFAADL